MKKLLLTLGSIAAVAAPVASVVACGAPKQKHVKLTIEKVKELSPKIKESIENFINQGNPASATKVTLGTGAVSENNGNFEIVYGQTDGDMTVVLDADGNIKSITSPDPDGKVVSIDPSKLTGLADTMKDATVDHSGDDTDIKNLLVATDYDSDLFTGMTNKFPVAPGKGASNAEKRAYDAKADAFLAEYKPLVAKAAYEILADDQSLTISEATYNGLKFSQTELTEELIKNIGFNTDIAGKLQNLIDHGAKIFIGKDGQDISGSIVDYADGFNWMHGSGLQAGSKGIVTFA